MKLFQKFYIQALSAIKKIKSASFDTDGQQ